MIISLYLYTVGYSNAVLMCPMHVLCTVGGDRSAQRKHKHTQKGPGPGFEPWTFPVWGDSAGPPLDLMINKSGILIANKKKPQCRPMIRNIWIKNSDGNTQTRTDHSVYLAMISYSIEQKLPVKICLQVSEWWTWINHLVNSTNSPAAFTLSTSIIQSLQNRDWQANGVP